MNVPRVLKKRRYWVAFLSAVLVGCVLGHFRAGRQEAVYVAVGEIRLPGGFSSKYVPVSSRHEPSPRFRGELLRITGDRVMEEVAEHLSLEKRRDFRGFLPSAVPVAEQLRRRLNVTIAGDSDVIRIDFVSRSPRLSADVVNEVIDDFTADRYESRYATAKSAMYLLGDRLEALKQQVMTLQNHLLNLQKQLRTPGYNPKNSQFENSLGVANRMAMDARLSRIFLQARLKMLLDGYDDPAPEANPNISNVPALIYQLRAGLSRLQVEKAGLTSFVGPRHPEFKVADAGEKELKEQLSSASRNQAAIARAQLSLSRSNERYLLNTLNREKERTSGLGPLMAEYSDEQREFAFTRALYFRFVSRLMSAGIRDSLAQGDAEIVDRAAMPLPSSPLPEWRVILGSVGEGLGLMVLVIFWLESGEYGIKRIGELEELTGISALAVFPRLRKVDMRRLAFTVSIEQSSAPAGVLERAFVQGLFDLRQALQSSTGGNTGRTILFTSVTPAEGKTTVSCSVAVVIARNQGRVLLIDADMRRPAIHKRFGINGRVGLSTVLSGMGGLADSVQTVPEIPNLDVLASGPIPRSPADMLSSRQMQELLAEARRIYSVVLIDSPPVLPVTDGIVLSGLVDSVVWVMRSFKTNRSAILRCRSLLASSGAPVVGMAINALTVSAPKLSRVRKTPEDPRTPGTDFVWWRRGERVRRSGEA